MLEGDERAQQLVVKPLGDVHAERLHLSRKGRRDEFDDVGILGRDEEPADVGRGDEVRHDRGANAHRQRHGGEQRAASGVDGVGVEGHDHGRAQQHQEQRARRKLGGTAESSRVECAMCVSKRGII